MWKVKKLYKEKNKKEMLVLIGFSMGSVKEFINMSINVSENMVDYF